jgi:hypothetical protein
MFYLGVGWVWLTALKWKVVSAQNWLRGYRFGPVQRFRCCGHTTPYHSTSCVMWGIEGPLP